MRQKLFPSRRVGTSRRGGEVSESSKISRETSSQHARRGFVGTASRGSDDSGGSEASRGRRVVAAYLSGRLGEERGGLAEHLRRLGPHGGRAGTTGSCLRGNNKTTTRSTRALAAAERVRDGVTRDESRKREAGRVERRVRRKTNARGRVSNERRRARSRRRDACFSSPQELSSLISRVAFFHEHEKMIIPSTIKLYTN